MSFSSWPFRVFVALFALGGVIWLGASVARMVVGFDVFVPGTLVFKPTQSESVRLHTIWLFTLLGGWTGWSFLTCTVGGVGTAILVRRSFKTHGWLLMSAILLVLLIPVQAYVAWEDYQLWTFFDRTTGMPFAQPAEIIGVFLHRYTNTAVNVMLGMSLFAALTIILFCTIRPLQKPLTDSTAS
ncbi:MAG: hypothetical protein NTX15_10215 [Candidatus Kapabacteria bacterium]|nr:hypothetical protein [Candidatus Kapabacteria bacterium]